MGRGAHPYEKAPHAHHAPCFRPLLLALFRGRVRQRSVVHGEHVLERRRGTLHGVEQLEHVRRVAQQLRRHLVVGVVGRHRRRRAGPLWPHGRRYLRDRHDLRVWRARGQALRVR